MTTAMAKPFALCFVQTGRTIGRRLKGALEVSGIPAVDLEAGVDRENYLPVVRIVAAANRPAAST